MGLCRYRARSFAAGGNAVDFKSWRDDKTGYETGYKWRFVKTVVEGRTISPEKRAEQVHVKRAGNVNKLVVVKISAEFTFEAKMIDRCALKKGSGQHASVTWGSIPKLKPCL